MLEKFFLIWHVAGTATWVGAVFMGSFIDWPVLKAITEKNRFPFDFVVGQGVRVFPVVYFGVATMVLSGAGLVWLHPPADGLAWIFLTIKSVALALMVGSTLYGTLVTWPKIQFATAAEAHKIYNGYMMRANITFLCGIIGAVVGVILSRKDLWFPG